MAGFNCNSRCGFVIRHPGRSLSAAVAPPRGSSAASPRVEVVCSLFVVVCCLLPSVRTRADESLRAILANCANLGVSLSLLRWPKLCNISPSFPLLASLIFCISQACNTRIPRVLAASFRIPICYSRSVRTGGFLLRRYAAARVKMLGWNYGGGMKEDYDDAV